jgi:hypothetical protein
LDETTRSRVSIGTDVAIFLRDGDEQWGVDSYIAAIPTSACCGGYFTATAQQQ